jgi:hypothetical protein
MKDIALVLLNTGEYIIGQYEEDFEGLRVRLSNSYIVTGTSKVLLTPFPKYAVKNSCVLYRESIVTIVENITPSLIQSYIGKVGDALELKPEPVFLTEVPVIRDDTVHPDELIGDFEIEDEDVNYIEVDD